MTESSSSLAAALAAEADGRAAPPRSNGELVFGVPWESRAFGVAVALSEGHTLAWEQFRSRLIEEIAAWERGRSGERWSYYERWLDALEGLVLDEGLLSADELEARAALLAHLDAHDHEHDH